METERETERRREGDRREVEKLKEASGEIGQRGLEEASGKKGQIRKDNWKI